jgi:hypothetical protein
LSAAHLCVIFDLEMELAFKYIYDYREHDTYDNHGSNGDKNLYSFCFYPDIARQFTKPA